MNEENNEGKILIEETDVGRNRRENPEPEEKKKKRVSGWLIATAVVVLVGIVAGLAVYFVQQKQREAEVYERTVSVVTDKATTAATTEEAFEIEDSDDIVIAEDDAVGGDLAGEDVTESQSWSNTTKDADDEDDADDSTKKTTKRTTRRTTQWDPQKAAEDFWNGVSKWATP